MKRVNLEKKIIYSMKVTIRDFFWNNFRRSKIFTFRETNVRGQAIIRENKFRENLYP